MAGKCAMLTAVLVVIAGVAAYYAFQFLMMLDLLSGLHHNHYPGPCQKLKGIQPGSEGMHTLPSGLTFITSGVHIPDLMSLPGVEKYYRANNVKGRMYLFDFKKSEARVHELKIPSTKDFDFNNFNPHGISAWEDKKSGRHLVFVVNHAEGNPAQDRIEKFVYNPEKQELVHQTTYSDKSFTLVNDVQATGPDSFYVTNSFHYRHPLLFMAEMFFGTEFADVVYFDGKKYTSVAANMKGPNGIVMSYDQKYVYVAASGAKEVHVFNRSENGSLTLQQVFPVYSMADNFIVDPRSGDLYLGSHPNVGLMMQYNEDPANRKTPSQVLLLRVKDGNITSSLELLFDDGSLISGSSAAIVYDRKLLIGSVMDSLVLCDVNIPL